MVLLREYKNILTSDGKKHILAEFSVDSSSDLPSQEYGDFFIHMGSIAHDILTGDFYSIDSSGTWHKQGSSSASEG